MRRPRLLLAILFLLASTFPPQTLAQSCGKERWSVKTGSDGTAGQVALANPQPAAISDLIAITPPNPLPKNTRFDPTENTVFVVNATLTDYKVESDSDYHLVIMDDQGNTMIAEIPSPSCVDSSSPFAAQIANARSQFDAAFTATPSFQTANVPVQITGVGFFDFFHNQHGVAPNVIELHPVLDIQFSPAPSPNEFALSTSTPAMHLHPNSSASMVVTASASSGTTTPDVRFNVIGTPLGVTSQITPTGNGKAKVTFTAHGNAPSGTFPVAVTGTTKGRVRSQTVNLNVASAAENENEPRRWENQVISANSEQEVINEANRLGEKGWDLVSVVRVTVSPGWKAFFKRESKD
jgi:hypothetical protein